MWSFILAKKIQKKNFCSGRLGLWSGEVSLNGQIYRENKAFELRLKALDYTPILNERSIQDSRLNARKNFNYPITRTNEPYSPTVHKYRKNIRLNFYLKHQ
jgi:hypothetical protein